MSVKALILTLGFHPLPSAAKWSPENWLARRPTVSWNTSVSKTIVRNNFPCRCHDFQSESRINIFMLFTHLLETITSKVLSGPLSISFPIPVQVQFSLSSNLQSVDWVAAGRQPLGPHMAWPFAPGFKLLLSPRHSDLNVSKAIWSLG